MSAAEQIQRREITGIEPMSAFAHSIYSHKYAHHGETWELTAWRVATNVMGALGYGPDSQEVFQVAEAIARREFIPGGRYLYAAGRRLHQTQNCLLLRAEDSREGWAGLLWKAAMALQTGAGIGIDYSDIRGEGAVIVGTGGFASGPLELMKMVNEVGRGVMQGGSRRSAIWAGLSWKHPDIFKFINMKNWSDEVKAAKAKDFNAPGVMDMTNISVNLDDDFFTAMEDDHHVLHSRAQQIYDLVVRQMFTTAEPGFAINLGADERETLRNACTEVTSEDDSDICNLGSINLAKVQTLERFRELVDLGTLFLTAGTVYSDVPYPQVAETRTKNRRLGLGLMGIHEWLLKRGYQYAPTEELGTWLHEYVETSNTMARTYAIGHGLSVPKKVRAIAPTGTIAIIGETTSGIEPIFCVAYKRRYLANGKEWKFQYVIDPTAKRLIAEGVKPELIEDAYSLSYDIERRLKMQAWLQGYVDHAISSTINMPAWGTAANDESTLGDYGRILYKYLPKLRGITVYPDGCRGGQPLVPCTYEEAAGKEGVVFEESEERCVGGACGT